MFEPNERFKTVVINLINDGVFEPAETFQVILKNNVARRLHFPSQAVVTIQSEDSKYLFTRRLFLCVVFNKKRNMIHALFSMWIKLVH